MTTFLLRSDLDRLSLTSHTPLLLFHPQLRSSSHNSSLFTTASSRHTRRALLMSAESAEDDEEEEEEEVVEEEESLKLELELLRSKRRTFLLIPRRCDACVRWRG